MNRKSTLSLALMILAASIVATSLMLPVGSAQAASPDHKVVKTTISVRTSTQIGNMTLSPGTYRVRIMPESDATGHIMVQLSILGSADVDDSNPTYEETVVPIPTQDEVAVLMLKTSTVNLPAPAASTRLIPTSGDNNKASALEIRGSTTRYVFSAK
jgi:hypothetical protein